MIGFLQAAYDTTVLNTLVYTLAVHPGKTDDGLRLSKFVWIWTSPKKKTERSRYPERLNALRTTVFKTQYLNNQI